MLRTRPGRQAGAAALGLALACGPAFAPDTGPAPRPEPPAPTARAVPSEPDACRRIVHIRVSRSERRLRALCEGGAALELGVALGRDEEGPKREAGDWRTPEGRYRVSGPPRPSERFHLFIPIDYPSVDDAEAGLREGRLSESDYQRIVDAHARGEAPPEDTALGGEIGFHGEGRRWRGDSVHFDWTYGCIALSDADLERLADRVEVGTRVEIVP